MQTSSRQIDRSPRWILVLIASIFVLVALVHIVSDSGTFAASESPHAAEVTCSVVCDAATIATPAPEALADPVVIAVVSDLLMVSIVAVGVTRRRTPSLVALSISRT